MSEKQLHALVGSMQQIASVRPVTYREGRAAGMNAVEVQNGPMRYVVMLDKCLDISELNYKGVNFHFLSKPGLMGRNHFDTNGREAQRSIMGGLFFTCGYENICPPCEDEGVTYPMHGRMRSTPAEHVCCDALWHDGKYHLRVSGEMRESELFGENMCLRRTIESIFGQKSITITDEITNCAYRDEPMLVLYHFNMGYPLLAPTAELVIPSLEAWPRDADADASCWDRMSLPVDNRPEQVFEHRLKTDGAGNAFCAFVNDDLELGFMLSFQTAVLPKFMEWKSMASGDYVLGLELSNASVLGRLEQKKHGLPYLSAFETRKIVIKATVIEGKDDIARVREQARRILNLKSEDKP